MAGLARGSGGFYSYCSTQIGPAPHEWPWKVRYSRGCKDRTEFSAGTGRLSSDRRIRGAIAGVRPHGVVAALGGGPVAVSEGVGPDQVRAGIAPQRLAEIGTLHLVDLMAEEERGLLGALDPLGRHRHPEVVSHGDDGRYDRGVVRVDGNVADEGSVDLDTAERERRQTFERGEPGAEVIDRDPDPHAVEIHEGPDRRRFVLGERLLRHFHLQAQWIERGFRQHPSERLDKSPALVELAARQIHRDP